jgi:hypothetical protein
MIELAVPLTNCHHRKAQVQYYHEDIYLLQIGSALVAFKHNYIISQLNFDSEAGSFVKTLSAHTLMHFKNGEKRVIDHYLFELDASRKPESFQLRCIDSIPIEQP